jgi:hypothetical protein
MKDYIYLIAPASGWLVAQAIKFTLSLRKDGVNWQDLLQSGGFPSSHAAFMVSLATVVGVNQGIKSVIFAVVASLTAVIVYDSAGVRRTTGEQTDAILELEKVSGHSLKSKIHDSKGHSVTEVVAGVFVGLAVGFVVNFIL